VGRQQGGPLEPHDFLAPVPRLPDPTATPEAPPSKFTQGLRRRLAALSVVGALMVALPLVQVLRFQAEQIATLVKHQASLNPIARAVHVQRGLLAHRELAGQVLRGQDAVEPQRLQRQHDVAEAAQGLVSDLEIVRLPRARLEAQAMRDDFGVLAAQVAARRITATESDGAHRLLVEQALQVMDLAEELGGERLSAARNPTMRPAWAELHTAPRRIVALHDTAQADQAAAHWQRLEQAHGELAKALAEDLRRARAQRALLLAALAAMAMLVGALLASLWRRLARAEQAARPPSAQADSAQTDLPAAGNGSSHTAGDLMKRLRKGDLPPAPKPKHATWSDTAPLP
jgi:hypothetical protein